MHTSERLEAFIVAVEQEEHDLVIGKYYTDDATIQENQQPLKVGKPFLMSNERKVLDRAQSVVSKCIRPYFLNGDHVVIHWSFKFLWKDGTRTEIEEVSLQEWEGDFIKKEQFFYDPKQFITK